MATMISDWLSYAIPKAICSRWCAKSRKRRRSASSCQASRRRSRQL